MNFKIVFVTIARSVGEIYQIESITKLLRAFSKALSEHERVNKSCHKHSTFPNPFHANRFTESLWIRLNIIYSNTTNKMPWKKRLTKFFRRDHPVDVTTKNDEDSTPHQLPEERYVEYMA